MPFGDVVDLLDYIIYFNASFRLKSTVITAKGDGMG